MGADRGPNMSYSCSLFSFLVCVFIFNSRHIRWCQNLRNTFPFLLGKVWIQGFLLWDRTTQVSFFKTKSPCFIQHYLIKIACTHMKHLRGLGCILTKCPIRPKGLLQEQEHLSLFLVCMFFSQNHSSDFYLWLLGRVDLKKDTFGCNTGALLYIIKIFPTITTKRWILIS